jgi:hypothetical protein
MRDTRSTKLPPARPTEGLGSGRAAKPTPARALAGAEPRDATSSAGTEVGAVGAIEPDAREALLEVDGMQWTVRVLGRSGRSGTRSPPVLLLGFWPGAADREHEREATIVARTLSELSPARLASALGSSSPPPQGERPRPFFEGAGLGRRGGPSRGDS